MVRSIFRTVAALIALFALYLALAAAPIAPIAWEPSPDPGLTGAYAANEALAELEFVDLLGEVGPEDLTRVGERIVVSTKNGALMAIDAAGGVEELSHTYGRPLGLAAGADGVIWIADAFRGLMILRPGERSPRLVANAAGGAPIRYANAVDVGPDGRVYVSDSTARFAPQDAGGTLEASILDIAEHRRTGRVIAYDPARGEAEVLATGFAYANGVAVSAGGDAVFVVETAAYRIWRVALTGPARGEKRIWVEGLPGFPDNIKRGPDGLYWVGVGSPRRAVVDALAPWPWVRAQIFKLPAMMRPGPKRMAMALAFDESGALKANLQSAREDYPLVSGALPVGDRLYVASLTAPKLGWITLEHALGAARE